MTRAIDIRSIENATGKSWDKWVEFLERIDARELGHADIARKLSEQMGMTGWWAQTITVAFEQHIGRRKPGQTNHGKYQLTVSKTVVGTLDQARFKWLTVAGRRRTFSGVSVKGNPSTSRSEKFRYWHCLLSDGTRVTVGISQRAPGKSIIGLPHDKLKSANEIDRWRPFLEILAGYTIRPLIFGVFAAFWIPPQPGSRPINAFLGLGNAHWLMGDRWV
jgi:hypothetical protein